ncbi:MAG: DUF1501 domain-containing protein [bacterium]
MTTLNRRQFLIGSAGAGLAAASLVPSLNAAWAAPSDPNAPILVVMFLRGGMDGLNLVGPVDDPDYLAARTEQLRVGVDGLPLANGLPGFDFRMHPKAAPLHELYTAGDLAIVDAVGLKNGSRSHFEAQDLMEAGASEAQGAKSHEGWLARYVKGLNPEGILPVVSLGPTTPKSLLGYPSAVAMQSVDQFALNGRGPGGDRVEGVLHQLYGGSSDPLIGAGAMTLEKLDEVSARLPQRTQGQPAPYAALNGAVYPPEGQGGGDYVRPLQSAAQLMRLDLGVRIVTLNTGGWDTHQQQVQRLNTLFDTASRGLHAFWTDLGPLQSRVTIVVMSEFGRRVKSNNSNGTDHGHGSLMMVLGKGIKGGRMHGAWPGLGANDLDNGVDLAITTDYRAVLAEVLSKRMGCANVGDVFGGMTASQFVGVC